MARVGVSTAFCRQFGRRLRQLRESRHPIMSSTGLAVRAGLSVPYLSQLEAGKRAPSLAALFALAGALACEPWELLLTGPEDPVAKLLSAVRRKDRTAVDDSLLAFGVPSRTSR